MERAENEIMRKLFILAASALFASGCGDIPSKVITAEMLGVGKPIFLEGTLLFTDTLQNTTNAEAFAIPNSGYRSGTIKTIVFSNAEYALDPSSVCKVNSEIKSGESCDVTIDFHPTVLGPDNATMTITYDGTGGPYTSTYTLQGRGI